VEVENWSLIVNCVDVVMFAESLPDESVQALFELYLTSQGCVLLLVLKQHLKDMYGFTDR